MIVYRVAVHVHHAKLARARGLFGDLTRASRAVPGVISFDILHDPDQPERFVSIEVYHDQAAVDRQGLLPELADVMEAFHDLLIDQPCGTVYQVTSAAPWPTG